MSPLPHSPGKPCQHLLFQLCTLMFLSWPSIDQRTGTQRCMIQANHISNVSPWVCRYAESIGATHFVTSAKLNTGIDEVFLDVARRKCSSHNFALCAIYTLWSVYSCLDFTDYYLWWLKRMSFPPFLQDICCVFFSYVAIVICVSVSLVLVGFNIVHVMGCLCVTGVLEQRKSLGPEPATADARRKSVIIIDKQPTDSPAASKCCSWFDHQMDVCTCQSAHFLPLLSIVAQICYKSLIHFHVSYHVLPFFAFPFLCAFMFLFLLGVLLGLPFLYFSFVEPACIMS